MATETQKAAFRQALARYRNARNWSLRRLATEVGVSSSTAGYWEKGRTLPTPTNVVALEQALGLDPGTLARLLGYLPIAEDVDKATMDILQALERDPRLGKRERAVLTAVYRELTRPNEDHGSAS